jgi:hypothetical protein
MRTFLCLVALLGVLDGPWALAAEGMPTRAAPISPLMQGAPALSNAASSQLSTEQKVLVLQQQVATLQGQLAAVLAAVSVTPSGVTLQGQTVTINGGVVKVRAQNDLNVEGHANMSVRVSGNLDTNVGNNSSVRTASTLSIATGGATVLQTAATLDLKGSVIKLNGGTKPLATLGSQVQVTVNGGVAAGSSANGSVLNGSPTVLAD